jgi:hypothetical protein
MSDALDVLPPSADQAHAPMATTVGRVEAEPRASMLSSELIGGSRAEL